MILENKLFQFETALDGVWPNEEYKNVFRLESLCVILEDWAAWQARYSGIKQQSRTPCLTSGYSSKTFDDLLEANDSQIAELVEAAIDDLQPGHRAAINRRYGITAVFRFPRGNYEDLLITAHEILLITLPKKGIVI